MSSISTCTLLFTGKRVILNGEVNWNRKATVTKEEYLYKYLAKICTGCNARS
jgi:hypothetical protein